MWCYPHFAIMETVLSGQSSSPGSYCKWKLWLGLELRTIWLGLYSHLPVLGGGGVLLQCSVETGEGLTPGGQKGSYQTCPFLATASAFSNCSLQFWMHLAGTAVYLISCFLFGVILQRKAPEISLGKQCVSTAVMNLIPTCLLYSLWTNFLAYWI